MAGLKKNKRQKDTGSPNLVLVLFLIMFVISNIIFGLLLYFAYKEQDEARTAATKERLDHQGKQGRDGVVPDRAGRIPPRPGAGTQSVRETRCLIPAQGVDQP